MYFIIQQKMKYRGSSLNAHGMAKVRANGWANGRANGRASGRAKDQANCKAIDRIYDKADGKVYDKANGKVYGKANGKVYNQANGRANNRANVNMTQNYVILLEFFLFTNVGHKSKRKTRFKSLMTKSGPIGQISCYAKIVLCVRIMGLNILQECQDTQISIKNRTEVQIIVEVRTYHTNLLVPKQSQTRTPYIKPMIKMKIFTACVFI